MKVRKHCFDFLWRLKVYKQRRIIRSLYSMLGLLLLGLCLILPEGCGDSECSYDSDCEGKKLCKAGKCVSNLFTPTCKLISDCGKNETCVKGHCVSANCQDGDTRPCYEGSERTKGIGVCRAGTQICNNGAWGWCEGQLLPSTEVCDRLDNDCNGQPDDSPDCSSKCQDGQSRPCYTGPAGTKGIGICRQGTEACKGGSWSGCVGDIRPLPQEKCGDNLDNNCNGQIDENCGKCQSGQTRPCYSGPPTTRKVGTCADGTQTCQNGTWSQACTGEVKPGTEQCGDNKDNDCNGKVDELPSCKRDCQDGQSRPCYGGPPGTRGLGACKGGTQKCTGGQWEQTCAGEVLPGTEKCGDNIDNNCNGQTDESCGVCRNGDKEVCYTANQGCKKQPDGSFGCFAPCRSGIRSCINGQWSACQGEVKPTLKEKCGDNIDNDCNGKVDDTCGLCQSGKTKTCYSGALGTAGKGPCKTGIQTCIGGQWAKQCVGEVVPSAEKCNDRTDNDCDGTIDENCGACQPGQRQNCYTGPAGTSGRGACKSGYRLCVNNQWSQICTGEVKPQTERCGDRLDNDCDGQTDEGCGASKLHQPCLLPSHCSSGQLCLRVTSTSSVCFQNCKNNPTLCRSNTDGRTTCRTFGSGSSAISLCVRNVGTGSACDGSKSIFCSTGNACLNGTCKRSVNVSDGTICDYQSNPVKLCQDASICVGFGNGYPTVCNKACDPANAKCPTGFRCFSLNGSSGACLQNCSKDSDCRYANHQCAGNPGSRFCGPKPASGPIGFGGVCQPSVATKRCRSGLFCLTAPNATSGICSQVCTSSCPSSPRGAVCGQINTTTKACVFPCTSCPSGTRCNSTYRMCLP